MELVITGLIITALSIGIGGLTWGAGVNAPVVPRAAGGVVITCCFAAVVGVAIVIAGLWGA